MALRIFNFFIFLIKILSFYQITFKLIKKYKSINYKYFNIDKFNLILYIN